MFLLVFCFSLFCIFSQAHFDCANNSRLVMDAPTFTARAATDETFVHFNGLFAADGVVFRAHHACAQFVENLERGFVAGKAKLPLKL